jgi:hypothetical protein
MMDSGSLGVRVRRFDADRGERGCGAGGLLTRVVTDKSDIFGF